MGTEIELSKGGKGEGTQGIRARPLLLMEHFQLYFLVPRVLNFIFVPGLHISVALMDSLAAAWWHRSSETFMEV